MPSSENITELKNCTGKISNGKFKANVVFSLAVGKDGEFKFVFDDIRSTKSTRWLYDYIHGKGKYIKPLILRAYNQDNKLNLESDNFYLAGVSLKTKRFTSFSFNRPRCNLLVSKGEQRQKKGWYAWYQVQGLEGAGNIQIETELGKMNVAGSMSVDDHTVITGHIIIECPSKTGKSFKKWIEESDKLTRRVLDIFSLAHGKYYRWTMGQYGTKTHTITHYHGRQKSDCPAFPVFFHLNTESTLKLAIERYSEELCNKTGFGMAIKWLLEPQYYDDNTYISLFCALEHLLDKFNDQYIPPIISCDKRRKEIGMHLKAAIKDFNNQSLDKETRDALYKNLNSIFRHTLANKLNLLMKHYRVQQDSLGNIPELIKVRDEIIHKGHFSTKSDGSERLHDYTASLRELLVRILLSILGYEGGYLSHLNGQERAEHSLEK